MVPEVGREEARTLKNTTEALKIVAEHLSDAKPETVVVISPHGPIVRNAMSVSVAPYSKGNLALFGAPDVGMEFTNDLSFVEALHKETNAREIPLIDLTEKVHPLDHGVVAPLSFLTGAIDGAKVVLVQFSLLSRNTHYLFGKAMSAAAERGQRRVAVIASADLSHRLIVGAPAGYDPMGAKLDKAIVDAVDKNDARTLLELDEELVERGGECGLRSIIILMGALKGLEVKPAVLSYEGPFGVGYMVASCEVRPVELKNASSDDESQLEQNKQTGVEEREHHIVTLARQAVEKYILEHKNVAIPAQLTEEMKQKAGVFVCLKKQGHLRGCIGTFEPTRSNIAEEVVHNAISSATQDPRFPSISADELSQLTYSVDVLTAPERIDGMDSLDPKRYGVIVENGYRRGLLLPDLEGVDSVEAQVAIAKEKAGIGQEEPVTLYRFQVKRYGERVD
jgi:AmmeMemoRadiSam system protein A/AmmeMemoRadiSam system protein B